MAQQRSEMALVLVFATMLWAGVSAQSSDCTNVLISMSPCLDYITGNSSTPSSSCCTQLGSVVRSQPRCLCQVLNGGASNLGLNINQTQAAALPGACNLQTPSISLCNAGSPTGSPTGSADSPTEGPTGGPNNVPDNGASDATSTKLAVPVVFFLVFVASYASTFSMV